MMSKISNQDVVSYLASKIQKKSSNFVWKKKIERNLSRDDFSVKAGRKRKRELSAEIENLEKKREERAFRRGQRDEEMSILAKKRVHADFEKKEPEFQLHQFQIKSKIRLEKGKFKTIDVLRKRIEDHSADFYNEPREVFRGLNVKELEEVRDEIRLHLEYDIDTPMRVTYWQSILVICEWELDERDGKKNTGKNKNSISSIAESVLQRRTRSQLQNLQSHVELQLQSGEAKLVKLFEAILRYLPLYKAKACLKEMSSYGTTRPNGATDHKEVEVILEAKCSDDEKVVPEYMEERDVELLDSSHEVNIDSAACNDKFHVKKKPIYLNLVHFRYDWNRYNRAHFDRENPPPKIVRGYKFHIYYPDLVDKSITPSYTTETDKYSGVETGDENETCIIRFRAGQPYEDLAFRIVNKEWDLSCRSRFKCSFERGVLFLHFNFKH